jgi:hypothetical protein
MDSSWCGCRSIRLQPEVSARWGIFDVPHTHCGHRNFGSRFTAKIMAARVVGLVNSAINGVKAIPQVTNKVVDVVGKTAQKQCASHL